ncbi:MAG: hypothetical protein ACYTG6_04155 [Planctomycetota bacterium]|jgi:hypothetical protein
MKSRPLPVLKVLYRTAKRIQQKGGRGGEVLRPVEEDASAGGERSGQALHARLLERDLGGAERILAARCREGEAAAFEDLQSMVQDDVDVHRIVLPWRAWEMLDLTGPEHAETLLRQSVRFCIDKENERLRKGRPEPRLRTLLPRLLEEHALFEQASTSREASDAWIEDFSRTVFSSGREEAAAAAAAALAEGYPHEAVGEALSLAGNRLLLHDPGRDEDGTVHGASVGVHASDAANAWRRIARVTNRRNAVASLVAGAYHTAGQSQRVDDQPVPYEEESRRIETEDPAALLREAAERIVARDQVGACAAVHRYGSLGHPSAEMFDLLLRYAISEDGKLHAEKYYQTVIEDFATARPAFRWRHPVALARVTASEYGEPAEGYEEARRLLNL